MADLIAFHSYYSRHNLLSPSAMLRPSSHKPDSSENRSLSPDRTLTKAKSANDLSGIVSEKPSAFRSSSFGNLIETGFNTLRDPRQTNGSAHSDASSSSPSHHPDLSNEVATLSAKLVQAINNQTTLDDNLITAREELQQAQMKVQALELENRNYRRDIDEEILIKKSDVDYDMLRLKAALADEKAQRALIEKEKKGIEQELETLTAALFEEANKMVAAAKLEREAVEKKNEQLRAQVKDTELLLASHQDQLAELKSVLQKTNHVKEDIEARSVIASTAPSSPAGPLQQPEATKKTLVEAPEITETSPPLEDLVPGPSTSFPHFIKAVCRTDLHAFEEFKELFTLTCSKPPSRATSGSYTGLNVMSLANFGSGSFGSSTPSPAKSQTHSPHGSMSSPQQSSQHTPLKETRFYKRVLVEDIEPTLRLDAAPGISWLTRRSVLSGICEGSLLVEPMTMAAKKYEFPCSVCGERRSGSINERTHRFRTSDSETAQRYPLCVICLEKVRSCCEFTGYLRLILDGHLRVGDTEEEKEAWEETVRLRERMFWSRIGGGIVPLFHPNGGSDADDINPAEPPPEAAVNGHDERERDAVSEAREIEPATVNGAHDYVEEVEDFEDNESDSVYEDPFTSSTAASPTPHETIPGSFDTSEEIHNFDHHHAKESLPDYPADRATSPMEVEDTAVTPIAVTHDDPKEHHGN